jgi:hypothetical protein
VGKVCLPASSKEFTGLPTRLRKKLGSLFSVARFKLVVTVDAYYSLMLIKALRSSRIQVGKVCLPNSRKEFTDLPTRLRKRLGSLFSVTRFKLVATVDAACAGMGDQSVTCPSAQVKDGGKSLSLAHRGRLY